MSLNDGDACKYGNFYTLEKPDAPVAVVTSVPEPDIAGNAAILGFLDYRPI